MCTSHRPRDITRRKFTGLAITAAGVGLLPWRAWAADTPLANTLAIMCIDYRLVDPTVQYLDFLTSQSKKFDVVAMAGASLAGMRTQEFPKAFDGFWEQVQTATKVHPLIQKVIVIDHRECGAYKEVYGELTGDEEEKKHLDVMMNVQKQFSMRYARLQSEFWLMSKAQNTWKPERLLPPR